MHRYLRFYLVYRQDAFKAHDSDTWPSLSPWLPTDAQLKGHEHANLWQNQMLACYPSDFWGSQRSKKLFWCCIECNQSGEKLQYVYDTTKGRGTPDSGSSTRTIVRSSLCYCFFRSLNIIHKRTLPTYLPKTAYIGTQGTLSQKPFHKNHPLPTTMNQSRWAFPGLDQEDEAKMSETLLRRYSRDPTASRWPISSRLNPTSFSNPCRPPDRWRRDSISLPSRSSTFL